MDFKDFPNLVFASSTKDFGNMSFVVGDTSNIVKNRKRFLKSLGLDIGDVVVLVVKHSNEVVVASEKDLGKGVTDLKSAYEADTIMTDKKGIFLVLLTADCLPIFLYDPINNTVGLLHASRKNISQIINSTIKRFVKSFQTKPQNIYILIGPSIGPCHYEIGLWGIAKKELLKSGIRRENIFNQKVCNYENENYFSHRRAIDKGEPDFRFTNIIGIRR